MLRNNMVPSPTIKPAQLDAEVDALKSMAPKGTEWGPAFPQQLLCRRMPTGRATSELTLKPLTSSFTG